MTNSSMTNSSMPAEPAELQIGVVTSRMFSENCYFAQLHSRTDCIVFDPGFDDDEVLRYLADRGLTPAAILNTHGHIDHIAGNKAVKTRFPDAPLVVGEGDAIKLVDAMQNLSGVYGIPIVSPAADRVVREGDRIVAAGIELEVLAAPGHSIGHVVYVWKGRTPWIVFGGDVLFAGSVGRTDFPDGSFEQLAAAIHDKLFTMPDDTIVLPGHGPPTTIGEEKANNPFVGRGH